MQSASAHKVPGSTTVAGIDLSHYQSSVHWAAVAQAGFQYCFVKATEGRTSVDQSFARHWADAQDAGLIRGAYHFFRPRISPEAQAAVFLRTVKQLGPGDLPPVLDLEAPQDWTRIAPERRSELILAWLELVEHELKATPLLYLSPAFACDVLENPASLAGFRIWIAHYTSAESPTVPKPWAAWTFWQHCNARIAGISVPVDLNRFNGSLEDLKALSAGG